MTQENLGQTVWDNSNIYKSFDDPQLINDVEKISSDIGSLKESTEVFKSYLDKLSADPDANLPDELLEKSREILLKQSDISVRLYSVSTFASCQLSTDAKNKQAKELSGRLSLIQSQFSKATKPKDIFLQRAPQAFIDKLLSLEGMEPFTFGITHSRKNKDFLLSTSEEVLVSGLSQDGLHAWGKLYNAICGNMKVKVGDEEMGYAKAASLILEGNREKRKLAYEGIRESWTTHEESAAAILNAINGWRLEVNESRSHKRPVHYLDVSCHQSRIERETLNSLMDETYRQRDIGQQALGSMAKLMKVDKLAPYDLVAPAPIGNESDTISFPDAIDLIADAFNELTPEMGEFAKMMAHKGWIDAKPTEARSPGAYCTKFANVREPRVFMTYTGNMGNVITLAHELGHAYHNWVMRDLPIEKTYYSMTLAETASIFAETLVKKAILKNSTSREERLKILWEDAESAAALCINIPARYEFEKNLVEARKERPQSPDEMRTLMSNAWEKWYGDTISSYDDMYWASKLHFSISSLGFYNYPYLFGYLFSLGIYSKKDQYGDSFKELYHNILRDTGSMTAEELIKNHFDEDITQPGFWSDSLSVVRAQVEDFSKEI